MRRERRLRALFLGILCGNLLACAPRTPRPMAPERDPIEGFNRKIFWFNDKVDVYALEPVATGWEWVAPAPVRRSVSHFFTNLRSPITATNDLLQGKLRDSAVDVGRFAVNTTVGVAGFLDPASRLGLEQHWEDFGQTLGVWGVPPGPYLVLPFLGPSSPRDAAGLVVDYGLSVAPFLVDEYILFGARAIDLVNERSFVLQDVRSAKEASFDYYSFVRNAYFQRRHALVNDNAEVPAEGGEDLYNPEPNR